MVHPDHETRITAHRIFSVVLVPTSVCPRPSSTSAPPTDSPMKKGSALPRTLSRNVSVFSSSAALFDKLRNEKNLMKNNNSSQDAKDTNTGNGNNNVGMLGRLKSSYSRAYSRRNPVVPLVDEPTPMENLNKEVEASSLRLSSRQITLLLSSIWAQSISPKNMPENFESISHTYSLVLLFSRAKNSTIEVLVRSFQLAFSLRHISLTEVSLPPSRRRSLFTMSTSMIVFSSIVYSVLPLIYNAKSALSEQTADPFLELVGDRKLRVVDRVSDHYTNAYGSKEDDDFASTSLSLIQLAENQTKESFASEIVKSLENLPESNLPTIREQLVKEFVPDEVCHLGAQSIMGSQGKLYPLESKGSETNGQPPSLLSAEEDAFIDVSEGQTKQKVDPDMASSDLLSIDQLLESVLETAHQVGRMSVSTAPDVPYKDMARHCEALLVGKQQKMLNLVSIPQRQESLMTIPLQNDSSLYPVHTDFHRSVNRSHDCTPSRRSPSKLSPLLIIRTSPKGLLFFSSFLSFFSFGLQKLLNGSTRDSTGGSCSRTPLRSFSSAILKPTSARHQCLSASGLEGLAHFLEHMLFYASEKYPLEDSYSKYIIEHGGSTNAFTAAEYTDYYFDVTVDSFEEALDLFALFFVKPLMSADATMREKKAVDSENQKNLLSDAWRMNQAGLEYLSLLQKHLSEKCHPYHKFGTGNWDTLEVQPRARGLDTRAELIKFYQENYSANLMHLVVYSKDSLAKIQSMVEEKFSDVQNTDKNRSHFTGQPCTSEHLQILVKSVPIKQGHKLHVMWPIAPEIHHYKEGPSRYLGHLIGHEGEGSLFYILKKLGWATSLSAGESDWSLEFAFFRVVIDLTDSGHERMKDIIGLLFKYISLLQESGVCEWIFDEAYPPADWIVGSSLPCKFNPSTIRMVLDDLSMKNVRIFWESKNFEGLTDMVEPWYGTAYCVEHVTDSKIEEWMQSIPNENLHMPIPNVFVPTDLSLKNSEEKVKLPVSLKQSPYTKLWFKPDTTFSTPKAYVKIDFICPLASNSPENEVLTDIFTRLLMDYLNEYAYYAQVTVLGYNHKLRILLETVLEKIATFDVRLD
ncbi:hypothetical protein SAY86_031112 [Trapa natans]|uniref:Uncharacterized protein n=1 Tax=Trapa natans TaxID=22666 RepID=A0AAN7MPF7_TRANT|nr:hypothetical protein SAY86_031112 [Trapa natans]